MLMNTKFMIDMFCKCFRCLHFEVHNVNEYAWGQTLSKYIISCDEDERLSLGIDIKYVHQLQNLYLH
jgi:hypothetical protein